MNRKLIFMAMWPATLAVAADSGQPTPVVTIHGSAAAYDARRDDTASKIVVGRDELTRYGDTNVGDVLKRQPGVTVDAKGAISMRGLGKGYTQILVNGDKVPFGFSLDAVSPDLIERIEISRTPTVDQRTEAIAGTINIILRKAARRSQRSAKLQGGTARGRPTALLSFQIGEPGERLSWDLGGTASRDEQLHSWRSLTRGADAAGDTDLVRSGGFDMDWLARFVTLAPMATLKLAGGDTLSLRSHLAHAVVDKDGRGFSDTVLGAAHPISTDRQVTEERNTQLRATLEWVHKVSSDASLNLKLNVSEFRRASDFRQQGYGGAGALDLVERTSSHIRDRNLKNNGRYARRLNDKHELVVGWDAERSTRWEDRDETIRRYAAPAGETYFEFDAVIDRIALYAQDEWKAGEQLALYLGLRAERIELRTSGNDFAQLRRSHDLISPVAQMLWKLPRSAGDQVRLGLSRTYKAPTSMALVPRPYTSTNNSALEPDERGNPHLRPELAVGLDAAFERHWDKGALVSLGGYVRTIDGVTRNALARENGRWVSYPVNGGRATLRGLEFDTRFKLAHILDQAPKADVRFNVTRNWSSVDDLPGPDNRVAEQLRLSSTLGADYQWSDRWTAGASYSYKRGGWTRSSLDRHVVTGNRRELDAYALYAVARALKLRLAVSNALADDELSGTRYRDAGGGVRQILETRTMPATLRATIEWSR